MNNEEREAYLKEHKEEIIEWFLNVYLKEELARSAKERKKNDINYALACALRSRLAASIKHNVKTGSAVEDLGCSIQEFKKYMEEKFEDGMTWENWGKYSWHIDHIIPLISFDLADRKQFLKACHYTNMQHLWAVDNLRKGILTTYVKK